MTGAGPSLRVLCLNGGSSSLKFALFRCTQEGCDAVAEGAVERIGREGGRLLLRVPGGGAVERSGTYEDLARAVEAVFGVLDSARVKGPDAVGHRIVHGGPAHHAPERLSPWLLGELRQAIPFAPLHLPAELSAIEVALACYPNLPQVVCFDTGFFRDLPELTRRLPLPAEWTERGVRRYGFHGLSYEHVVDSLGERLGARAVLAHLGSGASLAAVRDGRPIDTSMGLTPAGGVMMGTRPGDLDPGVMLHLLDAGLGARELERLVNRESGLLAVSGISGDMKTILERRNSDRAAALALAMFTYQVKKQVGAFAAGLGGIDALVFTGGIGQGSAEVRELACAGLELLGIRLDPEKNRAGDEAIHARGARCRVYVVAAREELTIARHTYRLLSGDSPRSTASGPPR